MSFIKKMVLLVLGACAIISIGCHLVTFILSLYSVGGVQANTSGFRELCIKNVAYYWFYSGVSVAYDKKGKVIVCE